MPFNRTLTDNSNLLAAAFLFVAIAVLSLTAKVDYSDSDPFVSMYSAQRLVESGGMDLTPYKELHDLAFVKQINGRYYDYFPPGTALFSAPFVALYKAAGADMRSADGSRQVQKGIAALVTALSAVLALVIARRWLSLSQSLLLTAVLFMGSSLLSTLGTALWNLNFTVFWMLCALVILTRNLAAVSDGKAALLGFFLFAAFLCRPTAALFILFAFSLLLLENRRALLISMLVSAALLALFAAISLYELGMVLPPYYLPSRLESDLFEQALVGNTFSPSRGLFVFSPFLLVLLAAVIFYRGRQGRWMLWGAMLWCLLHLILVSRFPHWWAGNSFGARLMTDTMPGWLLISIIGYRALLAQRRRVWLGGFALTACMAVYSNTVQGLFNPYTQEWNKAPGVDENPAQLVDWRYPQFLHNAERHTERYIAHLQQQGRVQQSRFGLERLNSNVAAVHNGRLEVDNTAGYLFYGPYEPLVAGDYRFRIQAAYEGDGRSAGRWDVVVHHGGVSRILAEGEWRGDERDLQGRFAIPVEMTLGLVEVRLYFAGQGRGAASSLQIEML